MDYIKCSYTKLVNFDDISFHPKNPNKHSLEQLKRIAKILEYQGFRRCPTVSKLSGYLIVGEGRIKAAQKFLGWSVFPIDEQDYESEDQEYADMVADNALNEWNELDLSMINAELPNLSLMDVELLGLKNFTVDINEKNLEVLEKEKRKTTCPACGYEF